MVCKRKLSIDANKESFLVDTQPIKVRFYYISSQLQKSFEALTLNKFINKTPHWECTLIRNFQETTNIDKFLQHKVSESDLLIVSKGSNIAIKIGRWWVIAIVEVFKLIRGFSLDLRHNRLMYFYTNKVYASITAQLSVKHYVDRLLE